MLGDVNPGTTSSCVTGFASLGSSLVFAADDGSHGNELWTAPTQNPTAVRVTGLRARVRALGVWVYWRPGAENDLLGYNLYRGRTKLNKSLIVGRHSWLDRGARGGTYRLTAVDLGGKEETLGVVQARR